MSRAKDDYVISVWTHTARSILNAIGSGHVRAQFVRDSQSSVCVGVKVKVSRLGSRDKVTR